jgi:hypothetical protein
MKSDDKLIPVIEKKFYLPELKKHVVLKTPDIGKMQEVVINAKTKMYIALGADPEEARARYLNRLQTPVKVPHTSAKTVTI